jgi:phosphoribosyl-ATP pyrophosphohydrolase/phosphoribosyl-AMP cyclohydrolase/histidinol dehydrogenase
MLGAAAIAGADAVLAAGGSQAVAALAFGAGDAISPCDVLVGPGNRYVTAAKHIVSEVVRIDMPAGPSELLIVADNYADPALVVADLLAQAEHDADARANLVTFSEGLVRAVEVELHRQLTDLPTRETAIKSLKASYAIVVNDSKAACDVCNQIAPEHLHLNVRQGNDLRPNLKNYGALFLGGATPEVLGDYGIGPNHVLPTGGASRAFGGLSVHNFLRVRTWIDGTIAPLSETVRNDISHFARLEGLEAHARSMDRRRTATH